ncbi:MAG TPA: hypothetical protein VK304_00510 [Thermoleophilaceae bacterium]|nr:hypothetical protein [Thermoleophilaceae bacterium]
MTPGGSWRDLRPHWAWYLAVPAAAVAGIAVAVVLFVSTVVGAVSSLQSFTAPGARTFALDEGDERGIYLETGGAGAAAGLGGVDCRVVGPDGAAVGLDKVTGSFDISSESREYTAVKRFEAARSGSHEVTCATPEGRSRGVALGPDPDVFGLIGSIFGIFGAAAGGLVLAFGLWLLLFALRYRDRRRRERPPGS